MYPSFVSRVSDQRQGAVWALYQWASDKAVGAPVDRLPVQRHMQSMADAFACTLAQIRVVLQ